MNAIKMLIYKIRRYIFTKIVKLKVGKFKKPLHVNGFSRVTKKTFLGKNVSFNGMYIRGNGNVYIGDNFHSGKDCLMINSYHKYDNGNAIPYDSKINIDKDIIIKDNVWLGDRTLILGGVTIEEGVIIQAGSVVVSDMPKYAIAGGNPASVFKYRDIISYKNLKKENKFC